MWECTSKCSNMADGHAWNPKCAFEMSETGKRSQTRMRVEGGSKKQ